MNLFNNPWQIKDHLKALLFSQGRYLEHRVNKEKLEDFLSRVSPIDCGLELIRLGGESDGGYLIPDDLAGISACFSPGVGELLQFERDLQDRGIKSFLLDGSIDGPKDLGPLMQFEGKFLKIETSADSICLDDWVAKHADSQSDLLLQMDIEGDEFAAILSTSRATLRRFRIMAIEFHNLDRMLGQTGFEYIDLAFSRLLQDFQVVHIHPNNASKITCYDQIEIPQFLEFTFLRSDRVRLSKPATQFPHPLDRANSSHAPDLPLPVSWQRR